MAKLFQLQKVRVGMVIFLVIVLFLGLGSYFGLAQASPKVSFFHSLPNTSSLPIKTEISPLNDPVACSADFAVQELEHVTEAHTSDIHQFESNGTGVAINDLNRDGLLDVVLANFNGPSTILWNRGDFRFEKEALSDVNARAVSIIDVDGDGWMDIAFTHLTALPGYWHNEGVGSDPSRAVFKRGYMAGVTQPAHSMAWADLNGDGALDMVAGSYDAELNIQPGGSFLFTDGAGIYYYENQGGVFKATRLAKKSQALAVALVDVNQDGHADILIGNDFDMPDMAWYWSSSGWQTASPFARTSQHTMSLDWGDIDNNGTFELFASDMNPYEVNVDELAPWVPMMRAMPHRLSNVDVQRPQNVLQVWGLNGRYNDEASERSVIASGWAWSSQFGDLNNDGYLDLYSVNGMIDVELFKYLPGGELVERNQAFRNQGNGNFAPAPEWNLGSTASGRGMVLADLNNDGRLDAVVNNLRSPAQLFENQICEQGGALEVDLNWPESKNSYALGARLALQTSAGTFYRDVRGNSGYLSGAPARVHFGLPPNTVINSLEIQWPDGQLSKLDNVQANALLTVTR